MRHFLIALLAISNAGLSRAASPEPLSAEELFRAPPLGEASLSPDGKHLGMVVTDDSDVRSLLIYDLRDYKPSALRGSGEFDISGFTWEGSDRILFSITFDKMYAAGLYATKIERLDDYAPLDRGDAVQIVGIPRQRPGRVFVRYLGTIGDRLGPGSVVEMDADYKAPANREMQRGDAILRTIAGPTEGTPVAYACDQRGELALCTAWYKGAHHTYFTKKPGAPWSEIPQKLMTTGVAVDFDARYAWVVTYAQGQGYALRRCLMETGELEAPVLTDPFYDIGTGRLIFSQAEQKLAGVIYQQRRVASYWFLKPYAVAQASIDKLAPKTNNVLVSTDEAERKFVFSLTGPTYPGSHVVLDLEAKTMRGLGDTAPWLKDRPLHPVQPITFKTRDGVQLEGYAAIPEGASTTHPAPLVVLAHGGPWMRDTAQYNPEVQFLVSRGYAVLQPNYRGSRGYLPQISTEKKFDFMRMHEDVTDATRSFLNTGIIDPKRVAIMGASFGGYLAVAGVAFEGDLYCCAVTECGVFDWQQQIKHDRSSVARGQSNEFLDEVDKPTGDLSRLDDISPVRHADRIRVPVLIAHGTDDARVDVAQSRKLAKELKERNIPVETFFRNDEGHGFFNYPNRVAFYHAVEAFLAANLGGPSLAK